MSFPLFCLVGKGHQKSITSHFKTQQHAGDREAESCENQEPEAKSHKVKEELEDPFFSDEELLSSLEEPSFLAGEAESAEAAVSRKRPLLPNASGSCDAGYGKWGKPGEALRTDIFLPEPPGQNESRRAIKQELDIDPLPDPCFGLLGTSSGTEPQGHIDQLPDEVLSHIFACLPVSDLYQSLSLVCHRWKRIIRDPLVRGILLLMGFPWVNGGSGSPLQSCIQGSVLFHCSRCHPSS